MNIVVTGGGGFIGKHLVKKLLEKKNFFIYILDRRKKNIFHKRVSYHQVDISKEKNFLMIKKKIDVIYHFAAQTSNQISEENPQEDIKNNIIATLNICQWAKIKKIKKIIFTSSMSVYGNDNEGKKENYSCLPQSNYGISKLTCENYIKNLKKYKIKYLIYRLYNVYGPGQDLKNLKQGMISIYLAQAFKKNSIDVKGSLKRTRDFIYIDDVVRSLCLTKIKWNNTYNIGTGKKYSVLSLLFLIKKILKKNINIREYPPTPGDIFSSFANISKIKKFSWKPKITLLAGLNKTIKSYNI